MARATCGAMMFEGYREHMFIQRVNKIPPELLEQLSHIGKCDFERWTALLPSMLPLSKETWYVRYRDQPLIAIGAVQLSLLDPAREMFMYGSRYLHWAMLPTLREMFNEWLAMETGPIYARSDSPQRAKYMKFFGFRLDEVGPDGVETYRVL